jgi:hypothetical protein
MISILLVFQLFQSRSGSRYLTAIWSVPQEVLKIFNELLHVDAPRFQFVDESDELWISFNLQSNGSELWTLKLKVALAEVGIVFDFEVPHVVDFIVGNFVLQLVHAVNIFLIKSTETFETTQEFLQFSDATSEW